MGTTEDKYKRLLHFHNGIAVIYVKPHTGYVNRMIGSTYTKSKIMVVKNMEKKGSVFYGSVWGNSVLFEKEISIKDIGKYAEEIKQYAPEYDGNTQFL